MQGKAGDVCSASYQYALAALDSTPEKTALTLWPKLNVHYWQKVMTPHRANGSPVARAHWLMQHDCFANNGRV